MTKILVAALAALTFAVAGPTVEVLETPVVEDNSGFYIGGAYTYADTGVNLGDLEVIEGTNNGGSILAGYDFNEYVAVEGRYTWLASDTFTDLEGYTDEVDGEAWSIFVKPQYPVTDSVKVYVLLGYGAVSLTDSLGESEDTDGFQYGIGASVEVYENVAIFADYVKLANDSDIDNSLLTSDIDSFNIGVTYSF